MGGCDFVFVWCCSITTQDQQQQQRAVCVQTDTLAPRLSSEPAVVKHVPDGLVPRCRAETRRVRGGVGGDGGTGELAAGNAHPHSPPHLGQSFGSEDVPFLRRNMATSAAMDAAKRHAATRRTVSREGRRRGPSRTRPPSPPPAAGPGVGDFLSSAPAGRNSTARTTQPAASTWRAPATSPSRPYWACPEGAMNSARLVRGLRARGGLPVATTWGMPERERYRTPTMSTRWVRRLVASSTRKERRLRGPPVTRRRRGRERASER